MKNKILKLFDSYRTPKAIRGAAMSMAFLGLSTSLFAKDSAPSFKDELASVLTVPELDDFYEMDYSDVKLVAPHNYNRSSVTAYSLEELKYRVGLVLNVKDYDASCENAAWVSGLPALPIKIMGAVESRLQNKAKSNKTALGLFQQVNWTAKDELGMKIGGKSDERLNPNIAAEKAALHLVYLLKHKSNGNFFTTVENGKTVYGAFAHYFGLVKKNGVWQHGSSEQYEANMKAMFDYFDLPYKVDLNELAPIGRNSKTGVLEYKDRDAFMLSMQQKKEEKERQEMLAAQRKIEQENLADTQLASQSMDAVKDNIGAQQNMNDSLGLERKFENKDTPLLKALKDSSPLKNVETLLQPVPQETLFDTNAGKNPAPEKQAPVELKDLFTRNATQEGFMFTYKSVFAEARNSYVMKLAA